MRVFSFAIPHDYDLRTTVSYDWKKFATDEK